MNENGDGQLPSPMTDSADLVFFKREQEWLVVCLFLEVFPFIASMVLSFFVKEAYGFALGGSVVFVPAGFFGALIIKLISWRSGRGFFRKGKRLKDRLSDVLFLLCMVIPFLLFGI